jgi:DNA-directed RNA polymerase specialized sigma24 family protein
LAAGNSASAEPLWQRYARRLRAVVRGRLRDRTAGLADDEDLALGAFASFCRVVAAGRVDGPLSREDVWRLLTAITARKASWLIRWEGRLKRGGGYAPEGGEAVGEAFARDAPPDDVAAAAEQVARLLDALHDPLLRTIAERRAEGYSVDEIAAELGCVSRTVERKLLLIRQVWTAGSVR